MLSTPMIQSYEDPHLAAISGGCCVFDEMSVYLLLYNSLEGPSQVEVWTFPVTHDQLKCKSIDCKYPDPVTEHMYI